MHAWEAIQHSLNTIEEHLSENISIESLAKGAGLSPYYFQRLFGLLVKKPVNEYIKLRRLAKASDALQCKEKRIVDVAVEHGFSDHANFTRAFKDVYGITPEEYRASPVTLNHFIKPDLLLNYVSIYEEVPLIADGIVIEVTRRNLDEPRMFTGIEGELPDTELSGGRVPGVATAGIIWDEFHRRKRDITHVLPDGNELGVMYMGDAREGCCTYFAGVETAENQHPGEYACFTLPRGEYAVCRFEAESFTELIGCAVHKASTFMNRWMKTHNLTCGSFIAEMYFPAPPDENRMEIWLPLGFSEKKQVAEKAWKNSNAVQSPSMATISGYVNNPLFDALCKHVETEYESKPVLEYSKCSMQYGWNVKYKKAGRTLCTLYPKEGTFLALIVIGEREQAETEFKLPLFTEYFQQLYRETKTGMGQKWLMVEVKDEAVLEDVLQCIAIRRGKKKSPGGK